jgi:hypothetical protein
MNVHVSFPYTVTVSVVKSIFLKKSCVRVRVRVCVCGGGGGWGFAMVWVVVADQS